MVYDLLEQSGMKLNPQVVAQARDLATKMLTMAAQNPLLGLADTTRVQIQGQMPATPGAGQPQPENPGAVTPVEPLNKTQLVDARVK
jgi:hypothetical protein